MKVDLTLNQSISSGVSSKSVELRVDNELYTTEELILFKHFKKTLEVYFLSFHKANISNIKKGKSLIQTIANFSGNLITKKKSKTKKNLIASETRFLDEVYKKPYHDEIVAMNILIFLIKCGACSIENL
jgi:hypothetical protein